MVAINQWPMVAPWLAGGGRLGIIIHAVGLGVQHLIGKIGKIVEKVCDLIFAGIFRDPHTLPSKINFVTKHIAG